MQRGVALTIFQTAVRIQREEFDYQADVFEPACVVKRCSAPAILRININSDFDEVFGHLEGRIASRLYGATILSLLLSLQFDAFCIRQRHPV